MPTVSRIPLTDIALATSVDGALAVSQGPGMAPRFDPALAKVDGTLKLRARDQATDIAQHLDPSDVVVHAVGPTGAVTTTLPNGHTLARTYAHAGGTMPFNHHYSPTRFVGSESVVDNVFSHGWHLQDVADDQASWTENWESRFVGGAPPLGLLERHANYVSIDRTVSYRPWVLYMDLNTHLQYLEYRVGVATWLGGPDGSIPLLNLDTGGGNGGRVRIENQGSASPLEVIGTAGNVDFQLNSGQNLRLATVQAADAANPTRDGVGLTMNGAYWTGASSAGAPASIQTVVTGNNAFHSLWSVGASNFAWRNDAKLALNVPLAKLTENIVMRAGCLAAIDEFDQGPYPVVGLVNGRVEVDRDGRGAVFPNTIHFGAYGLGNGPRIRGGAPGNDNYVAIDAGAAGSSTNIVYLNLFSQNGRVDAYGQFNVYADGSAGRCLAVGTGSPTGILFAGNGVAHYGIRCTAATGLFELMAAGGNDPRAWAASGASLAVPGSLRVGGGSTLLKALSATATLDFGGTPAQTSSDLTVSLTGAAVGDAVSLGVPAAPDPNTCFTAHVSAPDTVTVRFHNYSTATVDVAGGVYRVTVLKF